MIHKQTLDYIIADDHESIRDGINAVLANFFPNKVRCIGEANNFKELLALLSSHTTDCILLDLHMDKDDPEGLEMIRHLYKLQPHCKIIVFTQEKNPYYLADIVKSEVNAVLIKDKFKKKMWQSVLDALKNNERFIQPEIAHLILQASEKIKLSPRVHQILRMRQNKTVADIAKSLHLAQSTIYAHLDKAQTLLGANNIQEALQKLEAQHECNDYQYTPC